MNRQSLAPLRTLADEDPAATEFRKDLASTHLSLGSTLKRLGKRSEAEAEYRAAIATRTTPADANPTGISARVNPSQARHNLGLFQATGKRAEAEYRAALALRRELVDDEPANLRYRQDLARSDISLGRTRQAIPLLADLPDPRPGDTRSFMMVPALQAWFGRDKEAEAASALGPRHTWVSANRLRSGRLPPDHGAASAGGGAS